jgi:hypothetical protein
MMTIYYFAHALSGIVLGLVILVTFAESHITAATTKTVVRAFSYRSCANWSAVVVLSGH